MVKGFVLCGLSACTLLCGAVLVRAESVDELSRALTEKMRATKSLSAKIHSEVELRGPASTYHRTSDGTLELLRKDGQVLLRTETHEVASTEARGEAAKQEGSSLTILDGSGYIYSYIQASDQKAAYKAKSQVDWDVNPIEGSRAAYDIELLPDETFDGAAVCVFKLTPKPGTSGEGTVLQYLRRDCGYPVKMVQLDPAGKPQATVTYTDLKVDEEISPERFVFNAPEGVTVVDRTEEMAATATAPATAPASAPASAPAAVAATPAPQTAPTAVQAPAPATSRAAPAEATSQPAEPQKPADQAKKADSKKAKKGDSKKNSGKKGKKGKP
jgi:outer membrane lipoprotein-sorting protein